jgi:hypothetical protein
MIQKFSEAGFENSAILSWGADVAALGCDMLGPLYDAGVYVWDLFKDMAGTLVKKVGQLYDMLKQKLGTMVAAFKKLWSQLVDYGTVTARQLYDALKDKLGETCDMVKALNDAGHSSDLVALGSAVGAGLCDLLPTCDDYSTVPDYVPVIGGKEVCTSLDWGFCKEEGTYGLTHPSCTCNKKEICNPLGGWPCINVPTSCDCCAKHKYKWGIKYCSKLTTRTTGVPYCKKFW